MWIDGQGFILYLTKPVRVWDRDVIGAVALLSTSFVGKGGQVGEVPVQVDVLGISAAASPTHRSATLQV